MSLREAALKALGDLQSHRQTIGVLGRHLRRCKPGTKRHKEVYDTLTRLENEADAMASTIRVALWALPPSV